MLDKYFSKIDNNIKIDMKKLTTTNTGEITLKSDNIINKIEGIRINNNKLWMQILRLAFKYAPDESKRIFAQITTNDKQITKLSEELCTE